MTKIHATAIVERGAELDGNVEIGPFSLVGNRVRLGDGVRLLSHAVVCGNTEIGARSTVHPHAVLGGGPQFRGDLGTDARLVIGRDTIIREHVTMNSGSVKGGGITRVGDNGYFMAYSHEAHYCCFGDGVTFVHGHAFV